MNFIGSLVIRKGGQDKLRSRKKYHQQSSEIRDNQLKLLRIDYFYDKTQLSPRISSVKAPGKCEEFIDFIFIQKSGADSVYYVNYPGSSLCNQSKNSLMMLSASCSTIPE